MMKRMVILRRCHPPPPPAVLFGRCQSAGVRYGECRRNHAASMGGHAVDGCREFLAEGEEGTAAALRCAACGCHRSFHRRMVQRCCPCDGPDAAAAVARWDDCSPESSASSTTPS